MQTLRDSISERTQQKVDVNGCGIGCGALVLLAILGVVLSNVFESPASKVASEQRHQDFLLRYNAQEAIRSRAKDPSSVEFRDVRVVRNERLTGVCGSYNAKNSFGAYVGFLPFFATSELVVTSESANGSAELQRMIRVNCGQ